VHRAPRVATRARWTSRAAAIGLVASVSLAGVAVLGRSRDATHDVPGTTTLTSNGPAPSSSGATGEPASSSATAPVATAASARATELSSPPAKAPPGAGMIRASHILVSYAGASAAASTRSREEARARAEELAGRLARGEDFATLAAEYGDDATRTRAGDLGAFSRQKFPASFTAAAFALAPGQTSGIVETRYGFHVIRRTE
jgi:peptidyl-prolyl cis-trans isomerase NIMA-interacting 1